MISAWLVMLAAAPPVQLQVDACVEANPVEVAQALGLELRALINSRPTALTTRATVGCTRRYTSVRIEDPVSHEPVAQAVDPRPLLELRVTDPITGKWLERTIDLSKYPTAGRSRLLGIAVAELIRASWAEVLVNPHPVVPPATALAPPDVRDEVVSAVSPTARASLAFEAGVGVVGARPAVLWGGALRFAQERWRVLGWQVDAMYLRGSVGAAGGRLDLDVASASVGAFAHFAPGPLHLQLGLLARGGVGRIQGVPLDPTTTLAGAAAAPWGGPAALLRAALAVSSNLSLGLGTEVGYSALPVRAYVGGQLAGGLDSLWCSGRLTLTWEP